MSQKSSQSYCLNIVTQSRNWKNTRLQWADCSGWNLQHFYNLLHLKHVLNDYPLFLSMYIPATNNIDWFPTIWRWNVDDKMFLLLLCLKLKWTIPKIYIKKVCFQKTFWCYSRTRDNLSESSHNLTSIYTCVCFQLTVMTLPHLMHW